MDGELGAQEISPVDSQLITALNELQHTKSKMLKPYLSFPIYILLDRLKSSPHNDMRKSVPIALLTFFATDITLLISPDKAATH